MSTGRDHIILDCDGGGDDAWALILLLKADAEKHITLLAVTVNGNGNTTLEYAARNMLQILKAFNRQDIPIYFGCAEALITTPEEMKSLGPFFNGTDGFGDISNGEETLEFDVPDNKRCREHAVSMIYEHCLKYPNEVVIMSVGPLTNVALCYAMHGRAFESKLRALYIMGGNYEGVGNVTRSAEFNFYSDPEAAYIVLGRFKCPITILPWENCLPKNFDISLEWRLEEFVGLIGDKSVAHNILNAVEAAQYGKFKATTWCPSDALLVAYYLFGEAMVLRKSKWHCTVSLAGLTRGQMVLDHLKDEDSNPPNVCLIEQCNAEFFKRVALWSANVEALPVNIVR